MNKIYIVIVIFNTKYNDSKAFNSLINIIGDSLFEIKLTLFDNSSIKQNIIENYNNIKIEYVHDGKNYGLSKAYNLVANKANIEGYKYLLLLDQDTTINENYFVELLRCIKKYPKESIFVPRLLINNKIFSPNLYFMKRLWSFYNLKEGVHSLHNFGFINSGLLIDVNIFLSVGGYDEEVFLDYSDFQFIERLNNKITSFCIINSDWKQEFSYFEKDIDKAKVRYKYLIESANHFKNETFIDKLQFWIMLFHNSINRSNKFKDLFFIKYFYNNYRF
jgi:GT2 family glycosyltransferase